MPLDVEKREQVIIITIPQANLEGQNVQALWEEVKPMLSDTDQLVFDLSQVAFIDKDGCRFFSDCADQMSQKEGEVKVCCLSEKIAALFRLMAYDRIMDIYHTRKDAVTRSRDNVSGTPQAVWQR